MTEESAVRARFRGARAPALDHHGVLALQKVQGEILPLELSASCKFRSIHTVFLDHCDQSAQTSM